MENERREQPAPTTPILDAILAELSPPKLEQRMEIELKVALQKMKFSQTSKV